MERWTGRVAVVTGASAGIGAAITKTLVKNGINVVGMARRVDKIQDLAKELENEKGKLFAVQCDVSDSGSVESAFKTVEECHGGVDILVNNAGILGKTTLLDGPVEDWNRILSVNVIGLCHCTKLAVKSMRGRKVDDGQIIHIGSYSAYRVPPHENLHFYAASKHAVRALTEGLRLELAEKKTNIRVTSISPGLVRSDIYEVGIGGAASKFVYDSFPCLEAEDVAEAVINVLAAKPHVQIHDVIMKPIGEPL